MQPFLLMFVSLFLISPFLFVNKNVDAFSNLSYRPRRRFSVARADDACFDRSISRITPPMVLPPSESEPKNESNNQSHTTGTRRNMVSSWMMALVIFGTSVTIPPSVADGTNGGGVQAAWAAPPIAVIAEELGYFPVRNTNGDIIYIPKRVQRTSTPQSIELAKYMRQHNIYMAGTYWCPHTNRQRELFGEQAWNELQYIECSAKGYRGQPELCIRKHVDGYPTWIFGSTGKTLPGERSLSNIVQEVGFPGPWDEALEETSSPPPPIGGAACK